MHLYINCAYYIFKLLYQYWKSTICFYYQDENQFILGRRNSPSKYECLCSFNIVYEQEWNTFNF